MAKNCLASLFRVSFATPGTGEPSGIWPRIVLLPSVSVSLYLVLAKTMEYIQELACILVQRQFRYMLHWQRPRYMAGTGDRGVSLYTRALELSPGDGVVWGGGGGEGVGVGAEVSRGRWGVGRSEVWCVLQVLTDTEASGNAGVLAVYV